MLSQKQIDSLNLPPDGFPAGSHVVSMETETNALFVWVIKGSAEAELCRAIPRSYRPEHGEPKEEKIESRYSQRASVLFGENNEKMIEICDRVGVPVRDVANQEVALTLSFLRPATAEESLKGYTE